MAKITYIETELDPRFYDNLRCFRPKYLCTEVLNDPDILQPIFKRGKSNSCK